MTFSQGSSEPKTQENNAPLQYGIRDEVFNFIGREEELKEISSHLQKGENKIIVAGVAEVGNSKLTRRFIRRNIDEYRNKIWINAESERNLSDSFLNIANELEISLSKDRERQMILQDVFRKLGQFSSVIIYDNAESFKAIKTYLPQKKEHSKIKLHVFITTRNQTWPTKWCIIRLKTLKKSF